MNSAADLAAHLNVPNGPGLAAAMTSAGAQAQDLVLSFTGLTNGGTYQISNRLPSGLAFVVDEVRGTIVLGAAFATSVIYTALPVYGNPDSSVNLLPCRDVVTIEEFTIGTKGQMSAAQYWTSFVGSAEGGVRLFSAVIPPSSNYSMTLKNNYTSALTLQGQVVLRGHYVPVN